MGVNKIFFVPKLYRKICVNNCSFLSIVTRFLSANSASEKFVVTESNEKLKLKNEIDNQMEYLRSLRRNKANKQAVREASDKLIELKKQADEFVENRFILRTARGTRDYGPKLMTIRENVISTIVECFKNHGAETIDTPIIELKEVLLGECGDENRKLIFDLIDPDADEILALRYDLTVPFARYLAMNRIAHFKRYHIGKVYRRDDPHVTRGRFREFFQCDFDIAGHCDPMISESECLRIMYEILTKLNIGEFEIKVNDRRLLDGLFEICDVPKEDFRTICSSIDKLEKLGWSEVKSEMITQKRLPTDAAEKLARYVQLRNCHKEKSPHDMIEILKQDGQLYSNETAKKALDELQLLFIYCTTLGIADKIVFDLSLARGLDYYTGAIFEAVIKGFPDVTMSDSAEGNEGIGGEEEEEIKDEKINVGSIAGGGRYDNLVKTLDTNKKFDVPCVGISLGMERIFSIIAQQVKARKQIDRTTETEVYVASAGGNVHVERMKLAKELWDAKFKVEMPYKMNPKVLDQFQYCEDRKIPYVIVVGESEIEKGVVKLREVETRKEVEIARVKLIERLRQLFPK